MPTIVQQRCLHHQSREAVARCPACGLYYCRECIVEHEGRIICASCLAKKTDPAKTGRSRWRMAPVWRVAGIGTGLLVGWLTFYFLGRILLAVPSDFHAYELWQPAWEESP
jgi:hypothetical protein